MVFDGAVPAKGVGAQAVTARAKPKEGCWWLLLGARGGADGSRERMRGARKGERERHVGGRLRFWVAEAALVCQRLVERRRIVAIGPEGRPQRRGGDDDRGRVESGPVPILGAHAKHEEHLRAQVAQCERRVGHARRQLELGLGLVSRPYEYPVADECRSAVAVPEPGLHG